ncbi:MAG TPA: YceD family protein [Casimicrobiaceae bacterium]
MRDKVSRGRLDAFRIARERGVVEGSVDPHRLTRIADVLAEGPASIAWRIEGTADASGRPALDIELKGAVALTCQRCLGELAWPIDQRTEVLLAHDEREVATLDADSSAEVVLAEGPVDPLALVEDELVLALPFAPRHPDGACESTMTTRRA